MLATQEDMQLVRQLEREAERVARELGRTREGRQNLEICLLVSRPHPALWRKRGGSGERSTPVKAWRLVTCSGEWWLDQLGGRLLKKTPDSSHAERRVYRPPLEEQDREALRALLMHLKER